MNSRPQVIELVLGELPCGVWVAKAPAGEFVYANQTFAEIMGMAARTDVEAGQYSEPYGIFDRAGRLYPEDQLPFARALREQTTVVVDDLVIHRRDGGRVNVRAFARPIRGADGRIEMVAIIFSDITAEMRATESHALAQAHLAALVDHAPIALFSIDLNGIITLSQGAGLKAMGVRPGQLVGKSVFDLYADHPSIPGYIRRGLAGESLVYTVGVPGAVYESWIGPERDVSGKIIGVIGVSTDITESAQARAKAVQAERLVAMGTVAASVAHEINNPLAHTIESLRLADAELTELAATLQTAGPAQLSERVARLRRLLPATLESLERVRVVTRDLQTFSRPADEQRTRVGLSRAMTAALQLTAKPLKENARLVLTLDESLWVPANEARLVQVFVNLLVNAMQAIPEGSPADHEVRICSRAEGRRAVVEISDTGPGIPAEMLEHLFEPFATTKPVGEGTGLGLFVCRNLIEAMGGTIAAANLPGRGAVFRVALPLEEVPAVEAASRPSGPAVRVGRILVIDDNIPLARVMVLALNQAGHQAEAIFTGQAAIELLCSDRQFDVVFCDLMMKDISGMDVYQAVSERSPGKERELVFMTGGAFSERARHFLASTSNERLEKPFIACDEVARILGVRQ